MSVALFDAINNLAIISWAVVIGSLLASVLAGVVLWQDIAKRSSKFFFFFGIINLFSGIVYAYFEGAHSLSGVRMGITILYSISGIVPLFFFLFLYVFSVEKSEMTFRKFIAFFIPYLVFVVVLTMYPDFIVRYQEAQGEELGRMIYGSSFLIYALCIFGYMAGGVILLIKKYRESVGIFKIAIRELLIAVGLVCVMAVLVLLLSPVSEWGDLFWVGNMAAILLIFASSLIYIKYNFWNIKIVATELFISIIILVLVAELFMASSPLDLLIKTVITILIIFSSLFLVGGVRREIQSKERIVSLSRGLKITSRRLKILDKKKSEFLSVASHHLRDPLTAIKGYALMLSESSFGDLPRPAMEAIEKIFISSGHLVTMISDFMDISRIESGEMNYNFTDVNMKELVFDVANGMRKSAEHSHLTFDVTVDGGLSSDEQYITVGDAGKLRQVISNLVDNSIKYTPRGEISVLLCKTPNGKKILFSLSDTGIGMSELTKEKIFKKFSRAEGVSKVYTEGTGLGLYVAMEIVKKHEGRIWAESKGEGHGSTFYIELEAKG